MSGKPRETRLKELTEMLKFMDEASREKLLLAVAREDPSLAVELQSRLFVFEDLLQTDERSLQILIREISEGQLALALKTASAELKARIMKNMPQRAAHSLEDLIVNMNPQRASAVANAQREILSLAHRLEDEGKIVLKE